MTEKVYKSEMDRRLQMILQKYDLSEADLEVTLDSLIQEDPETATLLTEVNTRLDLAILSTESAILEVEKTRAILKESMDLYNSKQPKS